MAVSDHDILGCEPTTGGSSTPYRSHRSGGPAARRSSQPYTRIHLPRTFAGVLPDEVDQMVTRNAAKLYQFDLDALAPVAKGVCPTEAEVFEPFPWSEVPEEAKACPGLHAENQREVVS